MMKRVCLYVIVTLIIFSQEVKAQSEFNLNSGTPLTFSSFGNGTYNKSVFYHSQSLLLIELAKKSDSNSAIPIDFQINARGGLNQFLTIKGNTGNVGIGTVNPNANLEVFGMDGIRLSGSNHADDYMIIKGSYNVTNLNPGVSTAASLITNRFLGHLVLDVRANDSQDSFAVRTDTDMNGEVDNIALVVKPGGNIGIGTTSPNYKLDVQGTIRATEIKVEAQTADFVFEDDYKLRPLDEVEAYVKENKHLPEIPSAKQMEADGVNVAEMNKLLLQKVEELTLYTINQEMEISKLKDREVDFREILNQLEELKKEIRILKKK